MTARHVKRAVRAVVGCCLALVAFWASLALPNATAAPPGAQPTTQTVVDLTLTVDDFTGGDLWREASDAGAATGGREETLGGEREITARAGGLRLAWDGDDGDPAQLQATGLGGADLSGGGLRDRFVLEVAASAQPAQARLRAWRDGVNWSEATLQIPGGLTAPTRLVLPFAAFKVGAGQGVAWDDVGALALEIDGATPALVLQALTVGSPLRVVRGETLLNDRNGNGRADRGDRVARTVTLTNGGAETVRGLRWQEVVVARQVTLERASLRATGGELDNAAGGPLTLAVAELAPAAEATLRYEVTLTGLTIPVTLVTQDNDAPPGGNGGVIQSLNDPYTNGDGEVGFTGTISQSGASETFVWFDTGVAWRNSDSISPTLTGGEGTMGIGNNGQFIYSPSAAGDDAVWSQNGLLMKGGDPAPGFPVGSVSTFHSRPTMAPDGTAYWVAGFNLSGGTTSQGRMFYRSPGPLTANTTVVIRSDDLVDGIAIARPAGVGFGYQVSDNGSHHIHELVMATGSTTNDAAIYFDGSLVARESFPTGQGDNWSGFDAVTANDQGNYLVSGDTNGATATDYFLAYNGAIQVREGDVIGGVTLATTAAVRAASLNNLGQAVHIWGTAGAGPEVLFAACDASALTNSTPLLTTGDQVDVNADGTPDATVTDFTASLAIAPGLWLAEDGMVYVSVDMDYGAGELEANIGLALPCAGPPTITLDKTVGTDPSVCAMTDVITLAAGGGDATYCYTVENTGSVTFTTHDLTDSELGTILTGFALDLGPGESTFVTATATITATTVNTATWTAHTAAGPSASATDSATVNVTAAAPAITLSKTVGTDPNVCAVTDVITVTTGTSVTYCYTVQNTGNLTLTEHDLTDSELGSILTGFAYDLAPGGSAVITATAMITKTTINTATWIAYNGSPTSPESAATTDSATVNVAIVTALALTDLSSAPASRLPAALALLGAALLTAAALRRRVVRQ